MCGCVEAAQEILIGTHGLSSSRQRLGAGAAHHDSDEPSLVQALFLVMEATQLVDACEEVVPGTHGVFTGKRRGQSPSSVDDLARETSPFANLAGIDGVQNRLHRLPQAVGNDLATPTRRRTGHQLSMGILKQISSATALLAELDTKMV